MEFAAYIILTSVGNRIHLIFLRFHLVLIYWNANIILTFIETSLILRIDFIDKIISTLRNYNSLE